MNRRLNNSGEISSFFSFADGLRATVLFSFLLWRCFPASDVFANEKEDAKSASFDSGFSIVVLPDTQQYFLGKFKKWSHIFEAQIRWIFDNVFEKNIRFVVHLGDIVETNSVEEWELAEKYIKSLDGIVPYALAVGNHDVPLDNLRDTYLFNRYFPEVHSRASTSFGGSFEPRKMDNAYYFFRGNGEDFLVVALEPFPGDQAVSWANDIIARFPDHKAILVTHCYVTPGGGLLGQGDPGNVSFGQLRASTSNDGEALWRNLASRHKNIQMVLSGHILQSGVGKRVDTGDSGNYVFGLASNYQNGPEGGSGFLRIMQFSADGKRVKIETYSPYLDEYKTDPGNRFDLDLSEGKIEVGGQEAKKAFGD